MGECGWNFGLTNKVEWRSSSAVNLQLILRGESLYTGAGCDEQEKITSRHGGTELLTRAQRNGIDLSPTSKMVQDIKSKCESFTGLNSFLNVLLM